MSATSLFSYFKLLITNLSSLRVVD
jgi:hypothetical protein